MCLDQVPFNFQDIIPYIYIKILFQFLQQFMQIYKILNGSFNIKGGDNEFFNLDTDKDNYNFLNLKYKYYLDKSKIIDK